MSDYEFTQDWFHWAPEVWKQLIPLLPEGETYGAADHGVRSFLEIGSFEGRSTVWIIENMMRSGDWIDCVDTWSGGEEHTKEQMDGVEGRFNHNINRAITPNRIAERRPEFRMGHTSYYGHNKHGDRINLYKYKAKSTELLGKQLNDPMYAHQPLYDFIYIDGSHVAKDVMTDACMAWPLLKSGGIIVFDDYLWGAPLTVTHKPKLAIDFFTTLFGEELDIIHLGYQLIVKKKS